MLGKDNCILGTNTTACRASFTTIVGLLDENRFLRVDSIDPEQAEVDTLETVGTAAEIDYRIPATVGRLLQHARRFGRT